MLINITKMKKNSRGKLKVTEDVFSTYLLAFEKFLNNFTDLHPELNEI